MKKGRERKRSKKHPGETERNLLHKPKGNMETSAIPTSTFDHLLVIVTQSMENIWILRKTNIRDHFAADDLADLGENGHQQVFVHCWWKVANIPWKKLLIFTTLKQGQIN